MESVERKINLTLNGFGAISNMHHLELMDIFDGYVSILYRPLSTLAVGLRVDPRRRQDVAQSGAAPLGVADGAAEPLEALNLPPRLVHLRSAQIQIVNFQVKGLKSCFDLMF